MLFDIVFVPAGTPAAIVDRLNGEIGKALADPAVRQHFLEADQEPVVAAVRNSPGSHKKSTKNTGGWRRS